MPPKTRATKGSTSGRKRGYVTSAEAHSSDGTAVTRRDVDRDDNLTAGAPQTPKPRQKRARFSDPGPNATTGLTPFMSRAGIDEHRRDSGAQTPSQTGRRKSAPVFLTDTLMDPLLAGRDEAITVQFSPLKQVLDPRSRRRLVRSGLSEEMNKIDNENKNLKKATAEIEYLQKKLEIYETQQTLGAHTNDILDDNWETMLIDNEPMDGTILMSDTPTFHRFHDAHDMSSDSLTSPEDTSPITPHTGFAQPVAIVDEQSSEELRMMAQDLAAVRKEKQDLFNEWRKLNDGTTTEPEDEAAAPPEDFMKQIVPRLETALKTETSLNQTLGSAVDELTQFGFSGSTLNAKLAEMRESFKSAWDVLAGYTREELLPAQHDGKAILETFVGNVRVLSACLQQEHRRLMRASAKHDDLKRDFDKTLNLLNQEQDKLKKLEESQEANTSDLLHHRMRHQELEQELEEKATAIARLHHNLKVVEEERDRFQNLIGELEQKQSDERQNLENQIAELEKSLTETSRAQGEYDECLKQSLVDKENQVHGLVKQVDELLAESKRMLELLNKREQEIGRLNARFAETSTELQSTQADLEKSQQLNLVLETHNKQHIAARDRIEKFFKSSMGEISKVFDIERRRDAQNETTKHIFEGKVALHMQPEPMQLEPGLPSNSPFRNGALNGEALNNVRLGRGKDRSTLSSSGVGLDSGIGGSESAQPQTDAPANSDAFLEAIDEEVHQDPQ